MRPIATRTGIATSGTLLAALGVALAGDQLAAGLVLVALGAVVVWVAAHPELPAVVLPQQAHTASATRRIVGFTALGAVPVALVVAWLAQGGWFLGGLGVLAAAPGVGWMVDVWRIRLGAGRRRSCPAQVG